ncbi:MAG: helix-turn-helix transcriptional regulator [Blastochloris sp.]|nr:helix-turn-helix transcriptional regulator [Blastochloris sp.]
MFEAALTYLDRLPEPFLFLEERRVALKAGEERAVTNHFPKVVFVLESRISHRFDQEKPRPLKAGQILLNMGETEHFYSTPQAQLPGYFHVLRLTFSPRSLKAARQTEPENQLSSTLSLLPSYGVFTPHGSSILAYLMFEMQIELKQQRLDSRLRVAALSQLVLLELVRSLENKLKTQTPLHQDPQHLSCRDIQTILETQLDQPLTLGGIAQRLNRSEEHLARIYRKQTGSSIMDELRRLRMERAKYLLLCSKLSISAIAQQCGFQTLAHFSRAFHSHCGRSPVKFRLKPLDPKFPGSLKP